MIMKTPDIEMISMGELLIDMTPIKIQTAKEEVTTFLPNPGGAPANAAVMAAHLGVRTACVAMVGDDGFGHMLIDTLKLHGVRTDSVLLNHELPTTLAFVQLDEKGERHFSFYRKSCADGALRPELIEDSLFEKLKVLCYGSVSMAIEPLSTSITVATQKAKKRGSLLAFDPNYRPLLWSSEQLAVDAMRRGALIADIVKMSEEEALLISGCLDLEQAMIHFMSQNIKLVAITRGEKGLLLGISFSVCGEDFQETLAQRLNEAEVFCYPNSFYRFEFPAYQVSKVVDTTGAGDAFFGALIGEMITSNIIVSTAGNEETRNNQIRRYTNIVIDNFDKLLSCINTAQGAAALCISEYGAIPAMPKREDISRFLTKEDI